MSVHCLDDVTMKCGMEDRKIEALIPIHQSDLGVCRQNTVVRELSGDLRSTNEGRAGYWVVAVEMRKRVSSGRSEGRLRRKAFIDIRDGDI